MISTKVRLRLEASMENLSSALAAVLDELQKDQETEIDYEALADEINSADLADYIDLDLVVDKIAARVKAAL